MLVLSRRNGESIKIGKDVVVTVLGVRGEKIRLGVDAPKNVEVHRDEVAQMIADAAIKEESSQAKS
jgi:carbon storage regulator